MAFNITNTVFIERPQQEVFNFVIDFRNDHHWWKPIIRTEKVTPGQMGVGSEFRQVSKVWKFTVYNHLKVVEFQPPHYVKYVNDSPQLSYNLLYKFEPVGDGTNFTLDADITAHGILRRFLPVTIRFLKGEVRKYFKVLKDYLEQQNKPLS